MAMELESSRRHNRLLQFSGSYQKDSGSVFSSSAGNEGGPSTAVSEHSDMSSLKEMQINATEVDLQTSQISYSGLDDSNFNSDIDVDISLDPSRVKRRSGSQSKIPVLR
jgi:hypothetical protein